jgi:hypothetical protein
MRKVLIASSFALFGLMVARADAIPFPTLSDGLSGVTPVAFGCGPGWTRGPYGGCHPMGGYAVGAPRVYGAYGYHPYAHAYGYGYHPYAHRYGGYYR